MKLPHYSGLVALALLGGSTHAAEPAAKPKAAVAAAPKGTADVSQVPRYVQAAAGSRLSFAFSQAGAQSDGAFKAFRTELAYDEKNLAASTLNVTVQIGSLDTQDEERDTTLKSADLFDAAKHPTATYAARSLDRTPNGVVAVGKLTLRGVTKDLRVPLTIRSTATGLEIQGETTIKRLDYGVGQGDWQSTEWVGDDVKLTYTVALVKAK
jgi:polyisoprenoid-binding protein YceI